MKSNILSLLFIFSSITSIAQEIIPFELKDDNRIYIKASINKSDTLNMVFDLGANITVINKTRMQSKKVNINFDTIVSNVGGNGISNETKSLNNQVSLGKYQRKEMEVLGISYPEEDILDGIIGWNFFENKKVMINYESEELLIYDKLPDFVEKYNKAKLKFINGLPYIQTIIYKGKQKVKVWAMLDTGFNDALKVYNSVVEKNKLLGKYQVIGESTSYGTDGNVAKADWVLISKYEIGGFEIYNMPAHLIKTKVESDIPALLGGNLLKRFHIILDFEKKLVYFKPNTNINSKF